MPPSSNMNFSPFRNDIDELIQEFEKGGCTTLAEMKKLWLSRKFTYIFEARPSKNLAFFMQSLYRHCSGHMIEDYNLSRRLGGLYCLYCLYETQPFKPPYKIYLSLGELRRIKVLVVHAKERRIKVVISIVKKMLEKNAFLFGFVDPSEHSESDNVKKAVKTRETCLKIMHDKLFTEKDMEYFDADMVKILDYDRIINYSKEYERAKALAIGGAEHKVHVQDNKNIPDKETLFVDEMRKIVEDWEKQKESSYQQSGADCLEKCEIEEEQSQPMETVHPPARVLPSGYDGGEYSSDEDLDYIKNLEEQLSEI